MGPAAEAEIVFAPAVVPSVHDSSAATPDASVCRVAGLAGRVMPPPPVTVKMMLLSATGLLYASRTDTAGSMATALPTVAAWPLPALTLMLVAGPAVPVAVKLTVGRPGDVA